MTAQFLDVITTAAILFAVSAGLLIIFGVMKIINFAGGPSDPRVTELVKKLQDLDTKAPGAEAVPADFVRFNTQRAALLQQIIRVTKGPEQENWIKQLIDGLASAVQTGAYEDGLRELKQLEAQLKQQARSNTSLVAYVTYRRMLAEYAVMVQQAKTSAQHKPKLRRIGSKI